MREKLSAKNLFFTIADHDTMDLIFDVDGVKIIAKGVTEFDPQDEFFFDEEENVQRALDSARVIEEMEE